MNWKLAAFMWVALAWSSLAFCGEIQDAAKDGDLENLEARNALKAVIPAYATTVEETVASLQAETPYESVSNLYYVNDYYNPGPNIGMGFFGIPLPEKVDKEFVDAIMSNWRFRKSFGELKKMDKAGAAQLVKTNLSSALASYSRLYDLDMRMQVSDYKMYYAVSATNPEPMDPITLPAFVIGLPRGQENKEVLLGVKLKVLSLVWISGMLKQTDNKEEVEQVVRLAIKQRTSLYNNQSLNPPFRSNMLGTASLYNRQILSSGLLGVTFKDEGMESNAMTAAGIHWQEKKLVAYDAALTGFDRPVLSGMMSPDRSMGTLTVKYAAPMTDTNFDLLLQELHFK
jgi:hypothetical protein